MNITLSYNNSPTHNGDAGTSTLSVSTANGSIERTQQSYSGKGKGSVDGKDGNSLLQVDRSTKGSVRNSSPCVLNESSLQSDDDKIVGCDDLKSTLDLLFEMPIPADKSKEVLRVALLDAMSRFRPAEGELPRYALSDHTKPYTRNAIVLNDKYSLLLLCWSPDCQSRIHDHPCDACILTILEGMLKEERFKLEDMQHTPKPKPVSTKFYLENQTSYMSDDIGLHKICNPRKYRPAISLHLYYPPFQSCTIWTQSAHGTGLEKETARIGTYSYRGLRTPQSEGRLSTYGQVMQQLQQIRAITT